MVKINTVTLEGKTYSLGFKVVTENLESLGIRKNPNIVQYPINEWYFLESDKIVEGVGDFGGIWVTRTLSGANNLRKYMQKHYSKKTRIFRAALKKILYFNSYRIKTDGIFMFDELLD